MGRSFGGMVDGAECRRMTNAVQDDARRQDFAVPLPSTTRNTHIYFDLWPMFLGRGIGAS